MEKEETWKRGSTGESGGRGGGGGEVEEDEEEEVKEEEEDLRKRRIEGRGRMAEEGKWKRTRNERGGGGRGGRIHERLS